MTSAIDAAAARTDLIPASVPGFVVFLLALGAVLLWAAARYLTKRHQARLPRFGIIGPRVGMAVVAAWCALQLLGRVCELSGPWPIWFAALLAGLAVEVAAARYKYERRVISERLGLVLTMLRGLALLVLIVILLQPVRVWSTDRHITRRVAVLMDDSESMHFTDRQWTTSEMVELGLQSEMINSKEWPLPALNALSDWSVKVRPWTRMLMASNQAPVALVSTLKAEAERASQLQAQLDAFLTNPKGTKSVDDVRGLQSLMREAVLPAFIDAQKASAAGDLKSAHLLKLADAVEKAVIVADEVRVAVDESAWEALPAARRDAIKNYCSTTRFALGAAVLTRPPKGGKALLDRLAGRYDLYLARLGDGLELLQPDSIAKEAAAVQVGVVNQKIGAAGATNAAPTTKDISLRSLTDYPTALEKIVRDIPSEELAGVMIISDGRNNGAAGLEPIARRLGLQGVPVSSVKVGGSRPPLDVAIAEVQSPESIFLGDKVRMRVTVHVTGAKGNKINLMMFGSVAEGEAAAETGSDGEAVLDKAMVDVLTDDFTSEVRMTDAPKQHGIRSYTIRANLLEGELFTTNNQWKVDVAVSDDRTNVLLVDGRPRWEFRYLRNLFFGRDKSVHLQYFQVNPDKVEGVTVPPLPPASASRKFGDAESGSLPVSRDEWRKFGMIIIGDVNAETLTPEVLSDIRHCVSERGALLVVIAGRHYMPGSYDDEIMKELLPIRYDLRAGSDAMLAGLRSRIVLTGSGGSHPVMQQSGSYSENAAIWEDMPITTWRFPVTGVKPGAEILAYAAPAEGQAKDTGSGVDVASAGARLDDEATKRARNALIVAQNYGRGKVLMMNFDQIWRLRYKTGDTLHHKFWGQVMRWGVGEKLRAGSEGLRLGTDKLIYTPRETPRVLARVTDTNFVGVVDAQLEVVVTHNKVEKARVTPVYRKDSYGMYEVVLPACADLGRYEMVMTRKDLGHEAQVKTAFMVVNARRSVELSDVTSTRKDLDLLAKFTGGRVVGPDRAQDLWDAFGEGGAVVKERHERTLWDQPWVLLCLLGLLTAEWLLRKRGGLT